MALAMSVGATKIRIMQESILASLHKDDSGEPLFEKEASIPEEVCPT